MQKKITVIICLLVCWICYPELSECGRIKDLIMQRAAKKQPVKKVTVNPKDSEPGNHGITQIGLERGACLGSCPVYSVIFHSDGSVIYYGEFEVEKKGERRGRLGSYSFNRLADFIFQSGFMELADIYTEKRTCGASAYTMAVINNQQKIVTNYAGVGPTRLWAVEHLIDKMLSKVRWDDEPPKDLGEL